nr:YrzE family protein [bacterium]
MHRKIMKKSFRRGGKRAAVRGLEPWQAVAMGIVASILCLVVEVLLFAALFKAMSLSDGVIAPVNQALRMVAMAVGAMLCAKRSEKMGIWLATGCGAGAMLMTHLLYMMIAGQAAPIGIWLSDALLGAATGAVMGFIFAPRAAKAP